jgi:transcriptional regulator with XRE-family HTH domain
MKPFERITNPREIRRRLRMNQQEFWSRIGVTQSGGSRYESGRTMPKPVRELLRLVHIEGVDLARAKGEDLEVVGYLKQSNPRLYRSLRKAALSKPARGNRK